VSDQPSTQAKPESNMPEIIWGSLAGAATGVCSTFAVLAANAQHKGIFKAFWNAAEGALSRDAEVRRVFGKELEDMLPQIQPAIPQTLVILGTTVAAAVLVGNWVHQSKELVTTQGTPHTIVQAEGSMIASSPVTLDTSSVAPSFSK
jgi:hypothetical protein